MVMHNLTIRVHKSRVVPEWKPKLKREIVKEENIKSTAGYVYRPMKSEIKTKIYIHIDAASIED
jgi:hypothetical protein